MRKIICILLFTIFNSVVSTAQVNLILDTLKIDRIIYYNSLDKYDSITGDSIHIRLYSEYEEPSFAFKCTIKNNTEKNLIMTPLDSEWGAYFEVDGAKYMALITLHPNDTIVIRPFYSKEIDFLFAPDLFCYTRELESKEKHNLLPIQMKDKTDYSNIIYKMLSSFRLIYKQKEIELISDTPNVIILSKYDEDNIEIYEDAKK